MTCQSPAGAPGHDRLARHHDARIGRRHHEVGALRRMAIGIAEEEQEKRGEDQERNRPGAAEPEPDADGDQQGSENKGPPCPINEHLFDSKRLD